jgi:hypothetical protein
MHPAPGGTTDLLDFLLSGAVFSDNRGTGLHRLQPANNELLQEVTSLTVEAVERKAIARKSRRQGPTIQWQLVSTSMAANVHNKSLRRVHTPGVRGSVAGTGAIGLPARMDSSWNCRFRPPWKR